MIRLGERLEKQVFHPCFIYTRLGQFTRNYTQTVKRAADNKRRYAPGEGSIPPVFRERRQVYERPRSSSYALTCGQSVPKLWPHFRKSSRTAGNRQG